MRIGTYLVDPSLVLAPMASVTDKPFRLLCERMGAGYAGCEMTASDPRLWKTKKSLWRIVHAGEPEPVGVQIAGTDRQILAGAARYNVRNRGPKHGSECSFGVTPRRSSSSWLQNHPAILAKYEHASSWQFDEIAPLSS